ncbi:OPT oligopeptide transporter [Fomitiporia mediterranea MF3/22]|uniref:OPT oligopeptide transporter n=1 Tax=Fomitiporia mediterranea (strain MF3/22) TaxID=694068 RepID=UPI0004409C99|nr:OPT oligopeptide transporter [Fomitiporia mediterranea MF3/22]EJD01572.1 OPT oligopeptide transporter [Fomitiporia mediterranea MF3/22]
MPGNPDERQSFELSEAGSSRNVGLHNRRYSGDRSLHERSPHTYRSSDDLEQDIGQFPYPYDDSTSGRQVYVYDAKEDMEKGLPPYSGSFACSSRSLSVEGKRLSYVETDLDESDDPDYDDPNLDYGSNNNINFENDSPYPEVRSAVANTDDPEMPVNTIRVWLLGFIFAIIIPGLNQFFFFRYPAVTITGLVPQLLSYPLGQLWAALVPSVTVLGVSLNPGPFTVKEHVVVTIMGSVGAASAYATDIIAVQRVFYNQDYSFGYEWLLVMSTQLMGFAMGGIGKRYLVSPPSMIWPSNLVLCALFNTLHSQQYAGVGSRGGLSRERFFMYAFIGSFCWYFLPGYLFTALSTFSWVTWIYPRNRTVNQLFGYYSGLGMSVLTFDWGQIAYIGSPLATPWWAEANIAAGFAFFFWILTPALYYTNTWYSAYMPISSRTSYDNTGGEYNVSRILRPDGTFDEDAYHAYSPLFLSATFILSYGLSFAGITATIVHTVLYFRRQIWIQSRRSLNEQEDIHARLMSRYKQVPTWWYVCVFVSMSTFGIVAIEVWDTKMPVWALALALVFSFVYVIPIGMIQAITNQQIGLNVVAELIIGYALPGRPVAMMLFKTWGYIAVAQALQFSSDFKLGHYMKIPPRTLFVAQTVATVIAGTVQLAVQNWMFNNIPDICQEGQPDSFTCPTTQVFGTASIVWGVIGPKLQYSQGQLYHSLTYFFLVGAVAPIIPWALTKWWPNSVFRYINLPVIFAGTQWIPPATAGNYVPWTLVGFIFQYVIRRRAFSWWTKYNYVLSAALDSGYAISALVIFFSLQYPRQVRSSVIQNWWGNTVYKNTDDYRMSPAIDPQLGSTYGPLSW